MHSVLIQEMEGTRKACTVFLAGVRVRFSRAQTLREPRRGPRSRRRTLQMAGGQVVIGP